MWRHSGWLAGLSACIVTAGACAEPDVPVTMSDGPNGTRLVTHQGRTFSLAYEKTMAEFAKADGARPGRGGIIFTGSSSMVGWKSLQADMAPLPVVNRAFGGSTSPQIWWYADRAILARQPRVVVVYVGDNDLAQADVSVGSYLKYIRLLRDRTWAQDRETRLIFMSNKPSPARWRWWPKYQEANRRLERLCSRDTRLSYVDITGTLLDAEGQPRRELFQEDMLHLKPEAYQAWARVVRPVVEREWAEALAAP